MVYFVQVLIMLSRYYSFACHFNNFNENRTVLLPNYNEIISIIMTDVKLAEMSIEINVLVTN